MNWKKIEREKPLADLAPLRESERGSFYVFDEVRERERDEVGKAESRILDGEDGSLSLVF